MSFSAARSRLFGVPSRNRSSSPRDDDFATADDFETEQDVLIHSTAQFAGNNGQHLPQYHQQFNQQAYVEEETQGSTQMSIEIGRGVVNNRKASHGDYSMDATFELGDDSLYNVASTPSVKPRVAKMKADGNMRREASIRKASQNMKPTTAPVQDLSVKKSRTLSEALGRSAGAKVTNDELTIPPRNTRFSRTRASSAQHFPNKQANALPIQATLTANSFILPDLPNITELVSGVRKDGTPVFSRTTKSQSRFTSNTSRALRPEHAPITSALIPDEEKAIYASLQLLKEKNDKLERDYAVAIQHANTLQLEVADLRSQLRGAVHQPQSGMADRRNLASRGNEQNATSMDKLDMLLAQCRQDLIKCRDEKDRAVRERDQLITQAGVAYFNLEEVKNENEDLKKTNESLLRELDQLKQGMAQSKIPNSGLSSTVYFAEPSAETLEDAVDHSQTEDAQNLALRIAREVQRHRDIALNGGSAKMQRTRSRSRSKSRSRITVDALRDQAAIRVPERPISRPQTAVQDTRDLTELSAIDMNMVATLRKKLEDDLRASRAKRRSSTTSQALPRKSSMKDVTAGLDNLTLNATEAMTKTVRLQSPQPSDAASLVAHDKNDTANMSTISNTSRRRRRASTDGMTSAFIVPDITLHNATGLIESNSAPVVQHDAAGCTVCQGGVDMVDIPSLQGLDARHPIEDVDITSATVRPSQSPALALASVVKQLEDETAHLKMQLAAQLRLYNQHDPAISRRRRILVKVRMDKLGMEIERRSEQIYALYDALEGQKQNGANENDSASRSLGREELEDTLTSIGLDPARLSGHVGRGMNPSTADAMDMSSEDELPWEGLSDFEDDEERV